jgi:hypothetical protein
MNDGRGAVRATPSDLVSFRRDPVASTTPAPVMVDFEFADRDRTAGTSTSYRPAPLPPHQNPTVVLPQDRVLHCFQGGGLGEEDGRRYDRTLTHNLN